VFVTLRGGGLFVVDAKKTPMEIVAEYDVDTVHPNGCLGAQVGEKMYVDSGGGNTASHLYGADVYAFPVTGFSASNPPNVPAPRVVLSDSSEDADAHGATLTKHQRYLWIADRGRNFLWVIDTDTDEVLNEIPLAGAASDDPTPTCSPPRRTAAIYMRRAGQSVTDPTSYRQHARCRRGQGDGGRSQWHVRVGRAATSVDRAAEWADVHALTIRLK
jgi:DNA-binding beta-propeller fold protein YncE